MDRHRAAVNPIDLYRRASRLLAVVPLGWLAIFLVVPVLSMVTREFSASTFVDVFRDGATLRILWFTVWQAVLSTVCTILVAWPVTWACARYSFLGRRAVRGIVSTPFVLPTVVVAAAMRSVMPASFTSGVVPLVLAHVLFNIAVVVRIVGARWEQESNDLADVARTLGLSPIRTFLRITLPRLRGSLVASSSVVFVFCFTSFGVVRILGGAARSTLEVEIFFRAVQLGDVASAVSLSLVQIAVVLVVVALTARHAEPASSTARILPTPARQFPVRRRFVACACVVTVAAVSAPFVSMLVRSLRTKNSWSMRPWVRLFDGSFDGIGLNVPHAIGNSMFYAGVATCIALPLSLCLASVLAYSVRPDPLTRIVGLTTTLPLATSAVILGLGVVITFDVDPIDWRSHWFMFPITFSVIALPLMVRTLVAPLRSVPAAWRDSATLLGASPLRTWWKIDVRAIRRPIATAVGLCAAVSVGEFGATSFLTRSGHDTLPVVIARLLSRPGDVMQSSGYALAFVMVLVVGTVMARA